MNATKLVIAQNHVKQHLNVFVGKFALAASAEINAHHNQNVLKANYVREAHASQVVNPITTVRILKHAEIENARVLASYQMLAGRTLFVLLQTTEKYAYVLMAIKVILTNNAHLTNVEGMKTASLTKNVALMELAEIHA